MHNNHVKYFEYPSAKIESIDPEDEGFYQCIARNDYGEASNNYYLHIRPTHMLVNPPLNAKCYPMDGGRIFVTFNKESPTNQIMYFIATESPREFYTSIATGVNSTSFQLDKTGTKALKPFYLYMRNMSPTTTATGHKMVLSQLSKPIRCATQGIEAKFVKPPDGIFLRWDAPDTDSNITSYTIQFLDSNQTVPVRFEHEVIGTYERWPTYVSWETVANSLEKFSVNGSSKTGFNGEVWWEIQVSGNVTGVKIINTEEINVRILGTVMEKW